MINWIDFLIALFRIMVYIVLVLGLLQTAHTATPKPKRIFYFVAAFFFSLAAISVMLQKSIVTFEPTTRLIYDLTLTTSAASIAAVVWYRLIFRK